MPSGSKNAKTAKDETVEVGLAGEALYAQPLANESLAVPAPPLVTMHKMCKPNHTVINTSTQKQSSYSLGVRIESERKKSLNFKRMAALVCRGGTLLIYIYIYI
eukprot:Rmarinus@m.1797